MPFRREMKRAWIFVWLLQALSCASPPSEEVGGPGQGGAPSAIDPCPQGGFADAGCDAEPSDGGVPDLDAATDAGPVEPTFPAPVGAEADGDRDLGVGTGRDAFVALRHGDPLRWEAGIQGGHHVWVSARLTDDVLTDRSDAERREVTTRFTLTRRDGSLLGELTRRGGYRSVGGAWELVGNFSVLPPGIRPSRLDDEALHLTVSVTVSGAGSPDLVREVWARSECCD